MSRTRNRLEIEGSAWREGEHRGTLAGEQGLRLIAGVSRGSWQRKVVCPPFSKLVASLNPQPWPAGSGVRLAVQPFREASWGAWHSLGVYGGGRGLPRSEGSVGSTPPGSPRVKVDVLELGARVEEFALRLELEAGDLGGSPCLRRMLVELWDEAELDARESSPSQAWGRVLDVPERSQRSEAPPLSARGCSPTALAMVLEYWGHALPSAAVAEKVFDHGAQIYGNWSFNVSYAGSLGLRASVAALSGLVDLEAEISAGRPVVISHRYAAGELEGAPLPATDGHLVVVVGFSQTGDPIVHDPAADPSRDEPVRRQYRRAELEQSWLAGGRGIAYLITS